MRQYTIVQSVVGSQSAPVVTQGWYITGVLIDSSVTTAD